MGLFFQSISIEMTAVKPAGKGKAAKGKNAGKASKGKTGPKKTIVKGKGKAAAPATTANPLIQSTARNYAIGNDVQYKGDLTRYVKWPRYIKLQRQRRVLLTRLKVPPMINQFTQTLDKNLATQLFKLADKYRPEDKASKKKRLLRAAALKVKAQKEGKEANIKSKKPCVVKCGINHVTALVEQKKAKLVVIAHDVDPIELVVWLPTLCRRMGVPYCIVKGKARLGAVVRKKTATCLAFTDVNPADKSDFSKLCQAMTENYNNKYDDVKRRWGGAALGIKSTHKRAAASRAAAKEAREQEMTV